MPDELVVREPNHDDAWFAARMTNIQFEALAVRLDPRRIEAETRGIIAHRPPRRSTTCDATDVSRWLTNGWSTEQLLVTNLDHLAGDALRHSLHWAFPQAYYSLFGVSLGYFKAVGFTEVSHAAVIRKFGSEALAAHYPGAIAFTAIGVRNKAFGQLAPAGLPTSVTFSANDPALVDAQIAQFLGATRDMDLQEKKKDVRLLTARGKRRRAFRPEDWARVDTALGPSSILSLLYRKRIKANYRDIDSFLHEEIDAEALYRNLLRVVGALNFVHEVYIASAVGSNALEEMIARLPEGVAQRPRSRLPHVRNLTN